MNIYILASGSKGNSTYIKSKNTSFFIDIGISYQRINRKMIEYGEKISDVKSLFLTHEHGDHIYGLKTFLKKGSLETIYLTQGTLDALSDDIKEMLPEIIIIKADQTFKHQDFTIKPVMVSHDANEPVGFVINRDEKKFVLITDTGYIDESYIETLKNADVYLFEANHEPGLLLNSRRPFMLKQRILSIKGHLSNQDAAYYMNKLIDDKNATWVVAHISEDCNSVYDIEKAIIDNFDDPLKVEVIYASQESLPVIKI